MTELPMNTQSRRKRVAYRGVCECCSAEFFSSSPIAKFCGVNCRARHHYYTRQGRPVPPLTKRAIRVEDIEPTTGGLEVRAWQGTDIQRRADGWVNATAMCKANGREWFTYARSSRTQEYVEALKAAPQICGTEVVQSVTGGVPHLQGTWIHPRLAVDLARWISPAFAVWMDGWFLETINAPTPPPRPLQTFALKWNSAITIKAVDAHNATVQMRDAIWNMSLIESRQQQLSLVQV